jgi:hypothetical protein
MKQRLSFALLIFLALAVLPGCLGTPPEAQIALPTSTLQSAVDEPTSTLQSVVDEPTITPTVEDDNARISAVAIVEPYAYVGVGSRLHVLNVSQPRVPQLLGQTGALWDSTRDITLQDGFAYVTEWGGLHIIDARDPTLPQPVGFFEAIASWGIAVEGQYAYLCAAYSLLVLDIADPANPQEIGRVEWAPHSPGFAWDVAVAQNHVYVADGERGLRVYDVSDPARPTEVGSFRAPTDILSVAVQGDYAYASAGASGLRILDISDPTQPREIGVHNSLPPPLSNAEYGGPGRAQGVEAEGQHLYVALSEIRIEIINASNPLTPEKVGFWEAPAPIAGLTRGVDVEGRYGYVAVPKSGLHILDLSDSANPVEIGLYRPEGLTPDDEEHE